MMLFNYCKVKYSETDRIKGNNNAFLILENVN